MQSLRCFRLPVFAGLIAVCAAGCSKDYYRTETVLQSDGSVERAIYQPDVEDSSAWSVATGAERISADDWEGSITELPPRPQDEDHPYAAAWGRFDSVAEVPKHFEIKSPDESRSSRLVRAHSRTDYGFVVEHKWSETLTDIVTHDDMHTAVRELADLLISLGAATFEEAYADRYDSSEFVAWARREGIDWVIEICDIYWDTAARRLSQDEQEQEIIRLLAANATRHGLTLTDENGEMLTVDVEETIAHFFENKLRQLVQGPDGGAFDQESIEVLLNFAELRSSDDEKTEAEVQRLTAIASRIVEERFGSNDAFETHWTSQLARIVGIYGLYGSGKKFTFELRVPGTIVESNGLQYSDDEVVWRFDGSGVFPHGYEMTCRSLQADDRTLQELLPANTLSSRQALLAYVKLAGADEELTKLLIRCREEKSLAPFDDKLFALEADPNRDAAALARWQKLRELLLLGE